jgi:hypothetical protein
MTFPQRRFRPGVPTLLLAMLFSIVASAGAAPTSVTVSGRQILVDGRAFFMKGVGYSPVPIAVDPETTPPYGDYFTSTYSALYSRDLPLIRAMGANVIRLWGWNNGADHSGFLNAAYNNGNDSIYVVVTFFMSPSVYPDISSSAARTQIKADFRSMVAAHKNSPAVLMWAIGNELNASWNYASNLNDLFSLIDEMAAEAHVEEGSAAHPVTTVLIDGSNVFQTIATYDPLTPNLDVWSANIYRGSTFGALFTNYAAVSNKPFAILEYGIDSYDDQHGSEYETGGPPQQAIYDEGLSQELIANASIAVGGSVMAYSDEWWKGKYGETRTGCPEADPSVHGNCGYATASQPDGYSNEEWWGIMRTVDNGDSPDIMQPRAVYDTLRALWTVHRRSQLTSQ